ncbi:hypothetical protein SHO565_73920 [Streptomyces sp. HO565]
MLTVDEEADGRPTDPRPAVRAPGHPPGTPPPARRRLCARPTFTGSSPADRVTWRSLHQEVEERHDTYTDNESGAERRVLEGDVHGGAANEHEQYRPLIYLSVHP